MSGIVKKNFKILGKGVFELRAINTDASIIVFSNNIPKIGENITVKLKETDIMTFYDETYSIYEQLE